MENPGYNNIRLRRVPTLRYLIPHVLLAATIAARIAVCAEDLEGVAEKSGSVTAVVVINIEPKTERWKKLAVGAFEGLANRDKPSVYALWGKMENGGFSEDEKNWIERFRPMYGLRTTEATVNDLPMLLTHEFRGVARGVLLYPDKVIDSDQWSPLLNVYEFLAGAEALIPVPESKRQLFSFLPVEVDATRVEWGGNASKAYRFVYNKYKPLLTSSRMLAHNHPSVLRMVDYYVANRVLPLFYWEGIPTETQTLFATILRETGPGKDVIGCWDIPRWNVPGYEELANPPGEQKLAVPLECNIQQEHDYIRLLNPYGKRPVVTAEAGVANLSFTQKMPLLSKPWRPAMAPATLDRSKVYVTFTLTDGDNLFFWTKQGGYADWILNQESHDIPLQWTLNLSLVDLMPGLVDYVFRSADRKNSFAAGVSGYGYIMARAYATRYPSQREELLRGLFAQSAAIMKRIGLRTLWWMYDYDDNKPCPGAGLDEAAWYVEEARKDFPPLGLFNGYAHGTNYTPEDSNLLIRGTPCFSNLRCPIPADIDELSGANIIAQGIDDLAEHMPRPAFINFTLHPNQSRGMVRATRMLGNGYIAVNGDTLGELYMQAGRRVVK